MSNQTTFLLLTGLALRLFLIFPGPFESKVEMAANKADLRNYYWPAQEVLHNENPYVIWANGQSDGYRADMAPLELIIYVATVAIWNDPRAIQILFALFDLLNIGLLSLLLKYSVLKFSFQLFYALGPLTLYNLSWVPQDKTILLALTFGLFYFLRRFMHGEGCFALTIALLAALIAAFKWVSVFYLLPLLVLISPSARALIKNMIIFGCIVVLTHLLWFPSWMYVYAFRASRVDAPFHISPAVLFNALGFYAPILLGMFLAISLLAIYFFFWRKQIDIFETIALSTMAGIFWTPDMDPVHLSVIVLSMLLITNWTSKARSIAVWALGFFVSAIYAIAMHDVFGSFSTAGLQKITGAYASPHMILLSYSMFVAVFALYLWDKWRGREVGMTILTSERRGAEQDSL